MRTEHFMGDLHESSRPGILVGGGAYKARLEIEAFARKHSIPVFRTWNALDVVQDSSPVYAGTVGTYGGPGRNFGIQNCDLLLILGCRVSGRITGGSPQSFARGAKRYWVDLDAGLLSEHEVRPHHAMVGDAGEFIERAAEKHRDWTIDFKPWLAQCVLWRERYDPVAPEHLSGWHAYGAMRELSNALPEDAIVTYDTGGNSIMMGQCFRSKRGQRIFSSNGNTPMGFAMCGAIGAWFAQPQRPVICIIGDGGMQLNIQELQTVRHYEIPLKVFIFNNGILGNTKGYQRVNKKPEIACGPDDGYSSPNFVSIAKAYGHSGTHVSDWRGFNYWVPRLLASGVAEVVDIRHDDFCTYEPRISSFAWPIEDMYPHLPRDEFKNNMAIEPWKGWEKNI